MLANSGLDDLAPLRAIWTRVPCLQYAPTNEEVAALMRAIARKGHRWGPHHLPPAGCLDVAEAIVGRLARLTRNLDLRLLVNTFADRLQFEHGASRTHWVDLLDKPHEGAGSTPVGVRAARDAQEVEATCPRPSGWRSGRPRPGSRGPRCTGPWPRRRGRLSRLKFLGFLRTARPKAAS